MEAERRAEKPLPHIRALCIGIISLRRCQLDGKVYDLIANVRKKNDGSFVYSIQLNQNKKIEASPPNPLTKRGFKRVLNASNNNISQNDEDVNKKFSILPDRSAREALADKGAVLYWNKKRAMKCQ